jgi:hypothetical protein
MKHFLFYPDAGAYPPELLSKKEVLRKIDWGRGLAQERDMCWTADKEQLGLADCRRMERFVKKARLGHTLYFVSPYLWGEVVLVCVKKKHTEISQ